MNIVETKTQYLKIKKTINSFHRNLDKVEDRSIGNIQSEVQNNQKRA